MSQQEFIELMQQAGLGSGSWESLYGISSQNIADSMAEQYGISPEFFSDKLGLFSPFSKKALDASGVGFYSGLLQEGQSGMEKNLFSQLQSTPYKKSFGNFAGTGTSGDMLDSFKQQYQQQGANVITDMMGKKMSSLEQLFEDYASKQELASGFAADAI
tara:strand:+ start:754 stop:1230 length:477 start_codon:yes stop_codon:yes gene_type:complete